MQVVSEYPSKFGFHVRHLTINVSDIYTETVEDAATISLCVGVVTNCLGIGLTTNYIALVGDITLIGFAGDGSGDILDFGKNIARGRGNASFNNGLRELFCVSVQIASIYSFQTLKSLTSERIVDVTIYVKVVQRGVGIGVVRAFVSGLSRVADGAGVRVVAVFAFTLNRLFNLITQYLGIKVHQELSQLFTSAGASGVQNSLAIRVFTRTANQFGFIGPSQSLRMPAISIFITLGSCLLYTSPSPRDS